MATQDPIGSPPKRQKINNFDFHNDKHVYLLFNEKWECFKIGFSKSIKKRINDHALNGFWLLDKQKRPDSKYIESRILRFIKGSGFRTGRDLFEYQFDGWNECWHKEDLSPKNIDELIRLADEYEKRIELEMMANGIDISKCRRRRDGSLRRPRRPRRGSVQFPIGELNFEEMFAMAGLNR